MESVCPLQHAGCLKKQHALIQKFFSNSCSKEFLYQKLMEKPLHQSIFDEKQIKKENLVLGCQSDLYLYEVYEEGRLFFFTYTEALISSGIAKLFCHVYSGENPYTILTCKPIFFQQLSKYLSLGRITGGESLYLKMKQIACRYLKTPLPLS
ncbi:SufE family protein [Chlamydia pecorum]|uniref:SufE family protein n=1 Tax=Chlamydia pecorum TaxID=85991 RepID=UPI0003ADEEF5|nr:SufE family protein [Chlamydia pecorum]AGW39072.1 hypothetical protein CPE2_0669 [Chlamydia pecorum W73]AGW39998.1 hypothetical protein CPE3_0669 [Chlamydia pecorum P787]ETF37172.1 hypothetical protein CpecG_0931 [Chlamydia pecorum MC/MarsBar]ETF37320.1 hypothetical protein CpecF_0929 [Chlamydia pecorum DBDeUG]ETF37728.1 hypothetical protein CpecS_0927 [Chlamydia pecorum VR629]